MRKTRLLTRLITLFFLVVFTIPLCLCHAEDATKENSHSCCPNSSHEDSKHNKDGPCAHCGHVVHAPSANDKHAFKNHQELEPLVGFLFPIIEIKENFNLNASIQAQTHEQDLRTNLFYSFHHTPNAPPHFVS